MQTLLIAALLLSVSSATGKDTPAPSVPNSHDPDSAVISVTDVSLFWKAYDNWVKNFNAAPDKLAGVLQHDYLSPGSAGVKGFIPNRIISAEHLARVILANRIYYEEVRENTERIQKAIPEIRKDFREFKKLYPRAAFPPVYFVIGAMSSGGTSTQDGLVLGAEMLSDKNLMSPTTDTVPIVIHELVHFQQRGHQDGLLATCLTEGAADFVSELVAGRNINERNKSYGDSHEEELWSKFQRDAKGNENRNDWLYNYGIKDRPPDMGYYIGYKISQSFYQISTDKTVALATIMEISDPAKLLEMSGYERRFSSSPSK